MSLGGTQQQIPNTDSQGNMVPPQKGTLGSSDQPKPRAARVPRTVELVSAGSLFARMLRGFFALSSQLDDAEKQFGVKLYESMMNDPAAGSSVDMLRQAAIRTIKLVVPEEMQVDPGQDPTPEQAKAADILERCKRAIHNPDRPLSETLYEFTYGLVEDKMAEIVLDKVFVGPDAGKFTFKAFKFKPRDAWLYVVDPYGNVGFVAGRLPPGEMPPYPNEAIVVPGTGGNAILLDPDRFAVFSWGRRDSDPRCRPILRRAYNAWNLKVRTWPEKLKGDLQFGTPSIAVTMPENIDDPEAEDVAGLTLPDGSPVQTAEDFILYCALQVANGSAAAFPFGSTIEVVESGRDGAGLNASLDLYNKEIATAVLHAPRTTQEAEHGSKADSEGAADVTQLIIELIMKMLEGLLYKALKNLVLLNEGAEAAATMTPKVCLGDGQKQDMAKLITSWSALIATGAPTPGQLAAIDAKIDLPPRKEGEQSLADVAADRAAQNKQAEIEAVGKQKPEPGKEPASK